MEKRLKQDILTINTVSIIALWYYQEKYGLSCLWNGKTFVKLKKNDEVGVEASFYEYGWNSSAVFTWMVS